MLFLFGLCHVRTWEDRSHLETSKRTSHRTQPCWHPPLRLASLQSCETLISIVSAAHSLVSCYSPWHWLGQEPNQDPNPTKASSKTHTHLHITVFFSENGEWILKIQNAVSVKKERRGRLGMWGGHTCRRLG